MNYLNETNLHHTPTLNSTHENIIHKRHLYAEIHKKYLQYLQKLFEGLEHNTLYDTCLKSD